MDENRHALIVATSKYRDARLPPLRSPDQDAASLRDVLRNAEVGRFTVQVALNKRVQALRESLEEFFANRGRDDLLVVHFSCHGLKDDEGQLYLAAADTKVDLLRATALDTDWLRQLMNDCRSAKIAVFLDCCFGGAFATGMVHRVGIDQPGNQGAPCWGGPGRDHRIERRPVRIRGREFVGTPEASVFTKALVTGLESGEADRNDDGKVTINELFEYLADKVREASPGQTPTKWAFNEVGDWEIATSRRPSINLLPADLRQRMTSTDTVQRLSAVAELAGLLEAPDQRIADSAALAFGLLVTDDSERVKTAAKQLLRDRPTNPAPGRPEPRDGEDESARLAEERAKAAAARERQELERQERERQELERRSSSGRSGRSLPRPPVGPLLRQRTRRDAED